MGFFQDLLNYFYPKKRYRLPPGQTINHYTIKDGSEQEYLIMLLNKARSPHAARELLEEYQVDHVADLLPLLPAKRAETTFNQRARKLILKMAGHNEGDPYRCFIYEPDLMD